MRKLTTQLFKAFLVLLLLTAVTGVQAQKSPSGVFDFHYTIENDAVTSNNILEFDLYLLDTDALDPFEMATVQAGVFVNPAIYNGGTITASIVSGSSQLNASQVPTSVTFTQSANIVKLAAKAPPGIGNGTIISTTGQGTRICKLRLTNTVAFSVCSHADLAFCFTTTPYPTKVSIYTGGLNQACPINVTTTFSNATNVSLNCPPPTAYNVTGGGAYCQGGVGLPVGLDNSELGVTYTLYNGIVPLIPTVAGTGSAITFGNQLAGTYTVKGTNGGGTVDMTGSAIITETPSTPVSVSILEDANNICSGTTVNYTATPTNGGVTPTYQWYVGATAVGTGLSTYSYTPANNDQVSVVMTSSLGGCLSGNPATSNVVTMSVSNPGPASVSVAASANPSCGTESVTFTATPTNGGAPSYQWYLNSSPVGLNQNTYSFVPATGDQVYVVMTSSLVCATGNPATSNTVTMTVNTPVAVSVSAVASADPVCAGTTVTFTATPTNGGTPTYQWYKNTVAVGTNSDTYAFVPVNGDQVYVTMTSSLGCVTGNPATSGTTTLTVNALPTPTLAGPASICATTTGNVYTTEAGFSSYVWNVSAGGTITAGGTGTDNTVTVTWNTAGAQTVSVNYTNANNCTAAAATVYNVAVNALPTPTITGPAAVCAGITGSVYTTEAGMSGYTWTVSAGGTITAGGTGTSSTVTVTWNTAGPQTVSVNYTNANSCTAATATVYNVTVNALPTPTITGPASVCATSTGNVYSTQAGMTGYTWTVSAGGTITAGAGTSAITVTWNTAAAQTVSVNYTNANSCTAVSATVYNVTVNALPTPTIAGPASVCAGSTTSVYTTQAGMTAYVWTVSAGGTITAGAGTDAITVTWSTTGAKTVSVNYTNASSCTAAAATVYNVTVNALPVPTISGTTPAGVGSSQVYTTEAGMTSYVWTVSAGGAITAGAGTNAITVLWNTAGAQTVSVNYNNASGCTAATATVYNVSVISVPPPAGTITGVSVVCQGATGVPYSVAAIPNATGYEWTLPTGATIASGANTNSITVNFSATAVSGPITVYGTNTYGNGGSSPAFNVTVNPTPVPTITGDNDVCESSDYYTYTTEPGMTNYVWNMSANSGTITWVPGSNQVSIFWNSAGARWVSVSYTNGSGCTAAAPTVFNVTVHPAPAAAGAITGTPVLCAGTNGVTYSVGAITNATSYTWTLPTGATIASGANTNSITVNFASNAVSGVVSVSGTNACGNGASSSYTVTVFPIPATPVITQNGNILTSSAPAGNQWYWNGDIIDGATAQTYEAVYHGDYYSIVTLDGCSSAASNTINVVVTSVNEYSNVEKMEVYPNPTSGQFTVSITSVRNEVYDLRITNNLGVIVYEKKDFRIDGNVKLDMNFSDLPKGVYSVILNATDKQIVRKVVVK
ncbi:MAG: T9SS type A sorting domain-containing protein [Bacteroidales bacterium]|nr:T9SS type A sorting domain-containing protein [Bacteroidales bacterium]